MNRKMKIFEKRNKSLTSFKSQIISQISYRNTNYSQVKNKKRDYKIFKRKQPRMSLSSRKTPSLSFKLFKITRTPTEKMVYNNIKQHKEMVKKRNLEKASKEEKRMSKDGKVYFYNTHRLMRTKSTDLKLDKAPFLDTMFSHRGPKKAKKSFFNRLNTEESNHAKSTFIRKIIQNNSDIHNASKESMNSHLRDSIMNYRRKECNLKRVESECVKVKEMVKEYKRRKIVVPVTGEAEKNKIFRIKEKLITKKNSRSLKVSCDITRVKIGTGKKEKLKFDSPDFEILKKRITQLIRYKKEDEDACKEIKEFYDRLVDGKFCQVNNYIIKAVNLKRFRKYDFGDEILD